MGKKEEFGEIFELLKSVVAFRNQTGIITDVELREITKRVFEYRQGPELYRLIMEISNAKYFPSGPELEQQVRAAKGLKPLKGLTADLIDKHERECVVSGQDPKKAAIGAEMARSTLRKEVPVGSMTMTAAQIKNQAKEPINFVKEFEADCIEFFNERLLEDFDEVATKSVDEELESF